MKPEKESEALEQALQVVISSIEQGKDFLTEQAPLLVQEIVSYGRAAGLFWSISLVVLTVACGWLAYVFACKAASLSNDDSAIGLFLLAVCCGVASVVFAVYFPIIADQTIQAWFAPRLYVLHELKGLL